MTARAELSLSALALIRSLSPTALKDLAGKRGVSVDQTWNLYDLASALSEPSAVWRELQGAAGDVILGLEHLDGRAHQEACAHLVHGDPPTRRPEVQAALDSHHTSWSQAVAHLTSSVHHSPPTGTGSSEPETAAVVLPRVVDLVSDISFVVSRVSATEFPRRKPFCDALHKALHASDPEVSADWATAITVAQWAGFITASGSSWWVTPAAVKFVEACSALQIESLIEHWWQATPPALRQWLSDQLSSGMDNTPTVDRLRDAFPLLDDEVVDEWTERGRQVGVLTPFGHTSILTALCQDKPIGSLIREAMPPVAPGVYPDSIDSLVAPGPLSPEHTQSLAAVARCVRGGMAHRWIIDRDITLASLTTRQATDLIDELNTVVIGGLPHVLSTRIIEWEERARAIAVTRDSDTTIITCDDTHLADLLAVDHKLQLLHLEKQDETRLRSRRSVADTRQLLLEAGYPTFADDTPPVAQRVVQAATPARVDDDFWVQMVASARSTTDSAVWAQEVLRQAIADKIAVSLCVRIGGQPQWMLVEPQSLANGRLRVKDSQSDMERTLPLSTIVDVDSAGRIVGDYA